MKLYKSTGKYDCVVASIAMVLGVSESFVKSKLWPSSMEYPFPAPWSHLPMIPSMEIICDWMISYCDIALIPFPRNPVCTPHEDCPPVPVYGNPDSIFEQHLEYGPGLLEGMREHIAHMCAWDGQTVFDPRGYIYSLNAASKFNFEPTRFWLAVKADVNA